MFDENNYPNGGEAHIFDSGNSSSDYNNRILPIYECLDQDIVENTLYISNESLNYCDLVIKDESSTYLDNLSNPIAYYVCY